jgi:phage terminase large subunit-like protein
MPRTISKAKQFREVNRKLSAAEIEAKIKEVESLRKRYIALDPFFYFEPSDGTVSKEGLALLNKYLKPEDIPQRFDCQLDALLSKANIKGVSGGNQAGKSVTGAIYVFIWITGEVPIYLAKKFPMEMLSEDRIRDTRVVGISSKQVRNTLIPTYKKWVPREYLKNGRWKDSFNAEDRKLTLYAPGTNNVLGTCEFMTNEQDIDTFQGPPLGLVVYDEEPRIEIHKENLLRFTTAHMLNIFFCWTPTKGLSWATDLFDSAEEKHSRELFKLVSVTNKFASVEVLDDILSELTSYNEIKMRLTGAAISLSGLIYGELFNERLHVIPPFKIDGNNFVVYRGLDPHLAKPSVAVEVAVDREGHHYVVGSYKRAADTDQIKHDLAERARLGSSRYLDPDCENPEAYRLAQTRVDMSCDFNIVVMNNINIFQALSRGENAIPALSKSEKHYGSIHTGVDTIKRLLKCNEVSGKPKLFIFNLPENQDLITDFRRLERDTYVNESRQGTRDTIREGHRDHHACLRYVAQGRTNFIHKNEFTPQYEPANEVTGY